MADIILFHHVLGLTTGVRSLAERLSAGGHRVHTPDLYEGQVATGLESGFAIKQQIGDASINERIEDALADVPDEVVYAGISLGVMAAQRLAQTRPGALGALLYEACFPIRGEWAFGPWPTGLPVQIHGMDDDEFFANEGDLDAARHLVETVGSDIAAVYTYPGNDHLFIDSTLPSFDAEATDLVIERSLAFLAQFP